MMVDTSTCHIEWNEPQRRAEFVSVLSDEWVVPMHGLTWWHSPVNISIPSRLLSELDDTKLLDA